MTDTMSSSILYRANRLRFIIVALFLIPVTALIAVWAYDGFVVHDPDVRDAWLTFPLGALYIWFDYMVVAKLAWPPELGISLTGIRWSNYAMLQWPANYGWQDIEGPEQTSSGGGVPLLQFVVEATGRKLRLPPSHFGATYHEMASVISAAQAGRLISPQEWRSEHPEPRFRRWLSDWAVPISLGVVAGIALGWFKS